MKSSKKIIRVFLTLTFLFSTFFFFTCKDEITDSNVVIYTITPSSLDFDSLVCGSTSTLQATVRNSGTSDLIISNITSSDSQFIFTPNTFPITILPKGNKVFDVTFTPTTQGLTKSDITFTHNAKGSPTVYSVQGTGVDATCYFPLSIGNKWKYELITGEFFGPQANEDGSIILNWEITQKINDSSYVVNSNNTGMIVISSWVDSLNQYVPYDTNIINEDYDFIIKIINDSIKFQDDRYDFEEFSDHNYIPFKNIISDTLYIEDNRPARTNRNYLRIVKNLGIVEKFRDEGFFQYYFSAYIKLIDYSLK